MLLLATSTQRWCGAGGGIAARVEVCEAAGFAAGRAGKAVSGPM